MFVNCNINNSQDDTMYFGENAGKQWVTMSLSALMYNKINGIHSCNDLVQIMEMDNKKIIIIFTLGGVYSTKIAGPSKQL